MRGTIAPLKSLNLAYTFPYPPRSGYDLRVWNLMRCLSPNMRQTILCRHIEPVPQRHAEFVRARNIDMHSLPIASPNLVQKIMKSAMFAWRVDPMMAAGWYFQALRRRLESLVAANAYDFIVMEGIWLSAYWPIIRRSSAFKVLNHYDLETVRLTRQAALQSTPFRKWFFRNEARRMRRLERRILDSADLIWVTSEMDRKGLEAIDPNWPVRVAPNGVDADSIRPLPANVLSREILFVGSYDNFPNEDAVLYFAREILPLVRRRRPEAMFRIVGRDPTPAVLELNRQPGVRVEGPVDSLDPFYRQAAVVAVPIRSGGGTRLKILEAMAYGRPVVSTRVGAEGLDLQGGRHLVLADRPQDMAEAILNLLAAPEQAREMIVRARAFIEKAYNWSSIAGKMYDRYRAMAENKQNGVAIGGQGSRVCAVSVE